MTTRLILKMLAEHSLDYDVVKMISLLGLKKTLGRLSEQVPRTGGGLALGQGDTEKTER